LSKIAFLSGGIGCPVDVSHQAGSQLRFDGLRVAAAGPEGLWPGGVETGNGSFGFEP